DERLSGEMLRAVATAVHEVAPHGTDRGVARPDEERPAPVPATAEVLARSAPRRRTPEHQEARRPTERLQGGERSRPIGARAVRGQPTDAAASREVDLDDIGATRLRQDARKVPDGPERGQRRYRKRGPRERRALRLPE